MVHTTVIALSVSTAVLAVGFLSSLTALLTLKYGAQSGKPSNCDEYGLFVNVCEM